MPFSRLRWRELTMSKVPVRGLGSVLSALLPSIICSMIWPSSRSSPTSISSISISSACDSIESFASSLYASFAESTLISSLSTGIGSITAFLVLGCIPAESTTRCLSNFAVFLLQRLALVTSCESTSHFSRRPFGPKIP